MVGRPPVTVAIAIAGSVVRFVRLVVVVVVGIEWVSVDILTVVVVSTVWVLSAVSAFGVVAGGCCQCCSRCWCHGHICQVLLLVGVVLVCWPNS